MKKKKESSALVMMFAGPMIPVLLMCALGFIPLTDRGADDVISALSESVTSEWSLESRSSTREPLIGDGTHSARATSTWTSEGKYDCRDFDSLVESVTGTETESLVSGTGGYQKRKGVNEEGDKFCSSTFSVLNADEELQGKIINISVVVREASSAPSTLAITARPQENGNGTRPK